MNRYVVRYKLISKACNHGVHYYYDPVLSSLWSAAFIDSSSSHFCFPTTLDISISLCYASAFLAFSRVIYDSLLSRYLHYLVRHFVSLRSYDSMNLSYFSFVRVIYRNRKYDRSESQPLRTAAMALLHRKILHFSNIGARSSGYGTSSKYHLTVMASTHSRTRPK